MAHSTLKSEPAAGQTIYSPRRASNKRRPQRRAALSRRRSGHIPFALKIGVAMSFISIGGAMILVYLAVNQHWQLAQQQSDAFGQTIAEQLATSLVEPVFTDDYLAIQLGINQLASREAVTSVAVYQSNGSLIASSTAANADDINAAYLLSGIHESRFKTALQELPVGYYYAPVIFSGATAAYVIVAIDRSPFSAAFATSSQDLIVAVIAISLLSMVGAYVLSRMLSRPIYRLLEISDAAREGRVNAIGPLARKSGLRNEWADIFSIYEQLGNEVRNKREVEKLLQQFVATDVAEQLLEDSDQLRLNESVEATVLFVDIVEFTRIAEPMSPNDVANMLNRYLSIFASCARIHRGTVDKFIGDAAMIVFGAPRKDSNHRLHAMACAMAIQLAARQINIKREAIGLRPVMLRIGINSGTMRAGILGSEYRKEFTVVGDSVNLASRLCNVAAPGDILLSEYTCNELDGQSISVENAGRISVKGKEQLVNIYRLLSAKTPQDWVVTNLIEDIVAQQ